MAKNPSSAPSVLDGVLCELEARDPTSRLREKRHECLRLLEDAKHRDHSLESRKEQARQQTLTARDLKKLAELVEKTRSRYMETVTYAANYTAIWLGPPEHLRSVPGLDPLKGLDDANEWLVAELRMRERNCLQTARWYRSRVTQKPTQWGPATLEAVNTIVRAAHAGLSAENWSRKVKPLQQAQYYAGLLCMQAGVLRATASSNARTISDTVRKRLERGASLMQATVDERRRSTPTAASTVSTAGHRTTRKLSRPATTA
jgi:hypothetical protein